MIGHFLKWFVNRDLDETSNRIALTQRAVAVLEEPTIPELESKRRQKLAQLAQNAIRESLSDPETARFSDEKIKSLEDGGVVGGGMVASANPQGQAVQKSYVVVLAKDDTVIHVAI